MSDSCQVSLYLKGDMLEPCVLTQILRTSPTKAHRKGHVRHTSQGSEIVEKTGLWRITLLGKSTEMSSLILDVGRIFDGAGCAVMSLPGVDVAFVDVLLIVAADDGGGGTIEVSLDAESAQTLGRFGLRVEFTFAAVAP